MANFGTEPLYGSQPLPGGARAPLSEISGVATIAEEFAVDPTLPVRDVIYTEGQQMWVKIPKFTGVGMYKSAVIPDNSGTKPYLTICGPLDAQPNPLGVAAMDLYQENANRMVGMQSVVLKHVYLRYPFVNGDTGDNALYNTNLLGAVVNGDVLAPDQFGRPVKFIPKRTITVVGVLNSSKALALADATLRYLPLKNVQAYKLTTGGALTASAAWSTDKFVVTCSDGAENDVVLVVAEYGHEPQKAMGQIGRIKTGRDLNSLAGWLRRDMSRMFPFAPMINPMLTQTRSAYAVLLDPAAHSTDPAAVAFDAIDVTDVRSDGTWIRVTLPDRFIDVTDHVVVEYAQDGTNYTTLTNAEMTLMYSGTDLGTKFQLEPVSGTLNLFLSSTEAATTASRVRLSYKYDMIYPHAEYGANPNLLPGLAGRGIKNLTDGYLTGGVENIKPAAALHPDGAGSIVTATMAKKSGLMHMLVY